MHTGMKKYKDIPYGKFAPEVMMQPPFENPETVDDVLRTRLNREGEAAICMEFGRIAAYPDMMRVKVRKELLPDREKGTELRIYIPPLPARGVLLFCHGGSFCYNSLEVYDYMMRYFAAFYNLECVSVDYRLAPEYPYPQGLEDCYAALEWAEHFLAHPGKLPLYVAGDSSGGDFAAECDILVDDGLEYAQRLAEDEVPFEYHLFEGMPHGFLVHAYHQTFEALDIAGRFFSKY